MIKVLGQGTDNKIMIIDSIENKNLILAQFLKLCAIEGWNEDSLRVAFSQASIDPSYVDLIFPEGAKEIADFFIDQGNAKMINQAQKLDLSLLKIRDKIKELVKIRLLIDRDHKAAIKRLVNFYQHQPIPAFKNLYKIADLIWYEIGDQSTDFNFYSKRMILGKVYIRTLLVFIEDDSSDQQKSWDFLDLQIEKIINFSQAKAKIKAGYNCATEMLGKLAATKETISQKGLASGVKSLVKKLPFFRLYQ
jgi:ubiquinone biosynthesis protein COQ9